MLGDRKLNNYRKRRKADDLEMQFNGNRTACRSASFAGAWAVLRPQRAILVVGFILMAVNRTAGLVLPASTKYLLDDVILRKRPHVLGPLVLVVLSATVAQGLTSYLLVQFVSKSAHRLITELRLKMQTHVVCLPLPFYDATKAGVLISRIMSDVEGVRNLVGTGLITFSGAILTGCFAFAYLFEINILMTCAACLGLLVFGIGLRRALSNIRPIYSARLKINADVMGRLAESLSAIRVVKGYRAEEHEKRVFKVGAERLLDNALKALTAISLMDSGATLLVGIMSATVILIGTHEIALGHMTPGDLFSYMMFLGMLITPVEQLVHIGPQITEGLAGLERMQEVLKETAEEEDLARTIRLGRVKGLVEFRHVYFAYETKGPVLHDVNFRAEPGTITALVGPSGAGKSTVMALAVGFYKPIRGQVLVDGYDLTAVHLDSFRRQLGVVLQEPFLFDGTIEENVAFGRPEATREEIVTACRLACVSEFAERFEEKYDTVVGERGVRLSVGEKQRVSIARAILADARILLLDEATSSLDSESEAIIQESLHRLMRGRTTFVIAHRLSTIRNADQILVLEAGHIVELGTHDRLYASRGRYYDLYMKQQDIQSNSFAIHTCPRAS